jgi:YD repeat-containing protein
MVRPNLIYVDGWRTCGGKSFLERSLTGPALSPVCVLLLVVLGEPVLFASRLCVSGKSIAIKTAIVGVVSVALVGGITQAAHAALPTGPTTTGLTGSRPSATTLPFAVSDQVGVTVDVATGNLEVTTAGLALPGVQGTVAFSNTYNSLGAQTSSAPGVIANQWATGIAGAGLFTAGASGAVVYTAGDGATWNFTPGTTAGTYVAPAGFNRVLTSSGSTTKTYTLTDPASGQVIISDADGLPVSVKDRNGNTVQITNTSDIPTSIVSTAGSTAAKTATGSYNSANGTYTLTQGSGSSSRSVQWVTSNSNLVSYVDGAGQTTTFGYSGSDLTSITSPTGATTAISYSGTTHKVT